MNLAPSQLAALRDNLKVRVKGIAGVTGVGIGAPGLAYGLRIYIESLSSPVIRALPTVFEGVPVIVVQSGKFRRHSTQSRNRPCNPGDSISDPPGDTGTISALVLDSDGSVLLLANNHVAASEDHGNGAAHVGDNIFQPGKADGGGAGDAIATLKRWVPLIPQGHGTNIVDCAVAQLIDNSYANPSIPGIGTCEGVDYAENNALVVKRGRTTGITTGHIQDVDASVFGVEYDGFSADFDHQIMTTVMSQAGDSGSGLYTQDGKGILGILVGGSDEVSIYCKADNIATALGITFPNWKTTVYPSNNNASGAAPATTNRASPTPGVINPILAPATVGGVGPYGDSSQPAQTTTASTGSSTPVTLNDSSGVLMIGGALIVGIAAYVFSRRR